MLRTEGLTKRFGALVVTDDVSMQVRPCELHAVIGPNGAGKTSLINQLSGELSPDSGTVRFDGVDVTRWPVERRVRAGLMRSYQITSIFEDFTVFENVVFAAAGATNRGFASWKPLLANAAAAAAAKRALRDAGLHQRTDAPAADLGYGERRQLELAMTIAAKPKFLLLDEPMAGMSQQESSVVVSLLRELKKLYPILLIEHDMDAVFSLADRVSVLVYGRVIFTGTPDEIRSHPEVRAVYLGEEAV